MTVDARLRHSPSAQRNAQLIAQVLQPLLPDEGIILEIASGSGEHVARFAQSNRDLVWQPSDPDAPSRESVQAYIDQLKLTNVREPVALDVHEQPWPVDQVDAVLCFNMIHISPWSATLALFAGCATVVAPRGFVFLYGPYLRDSVQTAPGNLAFDQSLRSRDPRWGVRRLEEVAQVAADNGFGAPQIFEMPANNLSVVFRR